MTPDPSDSPSKAAPGSESNDVTQAAEQLEELVSSDTRADLFLEVLDKSLSTGVGETTFEEITRAGGTLMGRQALALVLGAATTDDVKQVKQLGLSSNASDFVLRIVALYGGALHRALHISSVPASRGDDWQSFNANSYRDLEDQEFLVDLRIEKFNGEKIDIRSSLKSTLLLAENILIAAMTIEDMTQIKPDHRERLKKLVDKLCARLYANENDSDTVEDQGEKAS